MKQPSQFSAAKRPQDPSIALKPLWERTEVIPMRHPPVEPQDGRWDLSAAENQPLADGCWGIWVPPTTVERHVTGLEMLNLPGEPCGDWRGHGVWLSRNFADDMGRRLCVTLSKAGPLSVHALLGAQGVAELRRSAPNHARSICRPETLRLSHDGGGGFAVTAAACT